MASNGDEGGAVGKESINTDILTLTRFLTEEQTKHKEATGDFTYVRLDTFVWKPRQLTHFQTPYPRATIRIQINSLLHSSSITH